MSSPIDNIVRPVGTHAKFNTARHSLGILRAVIVTCRYKVPTAHLRRRPSSSSPSSSLHDAIERALAAVILGQAMLRVGIAGEDTREPAFVRLRTIDMRRMIEWKELAASTPNTQAGGGGDGQGGTATTMTTTPAAYEDRLLRSLERHHEMLWEDLAGKPGWKIVVHHDPGQLGALRSGEHNDDEDEDDDASLLSLDISFCFHHAYADGKSAYIFHADLRRALNRRHSGPPPDDVLQDHILHLPATPPPAPALPPALDALVPLSASWGFVARTVWAEVLYPLLVPRALGRLLGLEPAAAADVPWTGAPVDGSNPRTHIRAVAALCGDDDDGGGEARLARVLARCRRHGASLTGLLHALVARSLGRLAAGGRPLRSTTPISLAGYARRRGGDANGAAFTPGETIHCLITNLACGHDRGAVEALLQQRPRRHNDEDGNEEEEEEEEEDDAALWAFARDMTARLRAKAASLPRDDITALSGLVGDWHTFFRARFGAPRDCSWELSNLGSLAVEIPGEGEGEEEEGGRWSIDRAVFTQGANATGAAICVNVAGVAGRGVYVTVTWQDGIVDVALAEALAGDLRAWVAELGEP